MRVISQPAYSSPVPVEAAIERLARARSTVHHQFWSCAVSILDSAAVDPSGVRGPKQVTDTYLLATAVANGGCFATFDGRVSLSAVRGATAAHLVVI